MKKKEKGFTLIEMLVVIAVIGILSATVLTSLGPARNKAKDTRIKSALTQVRNVAEILYDGDYTALAMGQTDIIPLKDEIEDNGGLLILTVSSLGEYRAYSQLNSGRYFCVDSSGKTTETVAIPAPHTCVCPPLE